jgi:hypothetical protein
MKIRNMKKMTKVVLAVCATMGLGGCDLSVPDLNNPSIESFQQNPTRAGMAGAATGLLLGNRAGVSAQNGYVAHLGILGREAFVLDAADPRYITEMLAGSQLDPGSPAFGGNFWTAPYANIRNANTLLSVLDKVPGTTEAEREAVRGFTKTVQALDFLALINTHDTNGAVIEVDRPLGNELAPIESKEAVLAHIARLLDEAKGHLEKGGASFPFPLSEGFVGFDSPAGFLKFNRAIKARVDVYQEKWDEALVDVAASFIDPSPGASLDTGAFHTFSGNPGDTANGLNSPNIYANPALISDADKQADGTTVDARVTKKIRSVKSRTLQGITSDLGFKMYLKSSDWVPIIRNEELLLLRAEANMKLGNIGAAAEALNDIRVRSGNLPQASLDGTNIEAELLKQRRYSLLLEGGHRWIDMRRYGKLEELRRENPTGKDYPVHSRFPIPTTETDARP